MAQIMPSRKKHVWSIKDLSNDKKIKLENPHINSQTPLSSFVLWSSRYGL